MTDIIKQKYKKRAVRYSKIWMYFVNTAIEVINDCREHQIKIYALEAFRVFGQGIQPDMEHSVDFVNNDGNWDEAIAFLSTEENAAYLYEIWYKGY